MRRRKVISSFNVLYLPLLRVEEGGVGTLWCTLGNRDFNKLTGFSSKKLPYNREKLEI
jgi:hypothetical protein